VLLLVGAANAADHCVVLQYHHVGEDTPGITSVTPEQFQQHLDYLHANGHVVLAFEEVVAALRDDAELPDKCVALTIDDAYLSTYTEAFPRANRYGYPLTVFVSTEPIDRGLGGYMSWSQMHELLEAGVRFQNHSHSHAHLIRRGENESAEDWEQRVAADIQTAQNRIAAEFGETPTLFAYPYGEYNAALKRIVESMGLVAVGQQSGPVWRQADLGALPRFPMASLYASMRTFPNKVNSLPLPITGAFPDEPVVPLDEWQPALTLIFRPEVAGLRQLTCYMNGSPEVSYDWLEQPPGAVVVTPKGRLNVGRNRTNCTLPIGETGRYGWYSHNWIRREADGRWYNESR
jgi:peptidoglycan/xylan/chitin deacetylase (PgdA/CDA1 family)